MTIRWRHIFRKIGEGEIDDAIIAYQCRDWVGETLVLSDEEAKVHGHQVCSWVTERRHRIRIDFYFFSLIHHWTTHHTYEDETETHGL